ncbi:hypothetical protein PWT90_00258 [Aphanocladium album]|nr:hypothetical protein PWT90_00258 [Aphanocladium album]
MAKSDGDFSGKWVLLARDLALPANLAIAARSNVMWPKRRCPAPIAAKIAKRASCCHAKSTGIEPAKYDKDREQGPNQIFPFKRPRRKRNASGELVSEDETTTSPFTKTPTQHRRPSNVGAAVIDTPSGPIRGTLADDTVSFDDDLRSEAQNGILQDPNFDPSHPDAPQQARAAMPIRRLAHKPHEIEYMRHQGVFNQLPGDVCDELVRCYFQHVHFFLPILDVPSFLNSYCRHGPQGSNPLQLTTLFLASANFIDVGILRRAGFSSRKAMKTAMYDRAKCLYDLDEGSEKLTLIRCVILLAFWYSDPQDHRGAWYWIGIAISLAQAINLHRASASNFRGQKLPPDSEAMARRIWWSLLVRDRWIALAKGRPMRIRNDSHDLSMPTRSDVLSELRQVDSQAFAKFISEDASSLTDMWLRMVQISDILGDVIQLHYRIKGPDPSMEEVNQISRQLEELKLGSALGEGGGDLHIHGLQIELLYQAAIAILYRPYALSAASRAMPDFSQSWWRNAVRRGREAASTTNNILEQLIELGGIKYLKPMMITAMVPATQIHLADCKSEGTLTRGLGRNKLQLCVLVFADLQSTYWSANVMYRLFQRAQALLSDQESQPSPYETTLRPITPDNELGQADEQLLTESQQAGSLISPNAMVPPGSELPVFSSTLPRFSDVDQLLSPGFALSEDPAGTNVAVSPAQAGTSKAPNPTNITIRSNNKTREFLLWVSPDYDSRKPTPAIVSFHGRGSKSKDQFNLDEFTKAKNNLAGVIAYPQGIKDEWQVYPGNKENDILFVNDLLDYLEKHYNVDKNRIYASGKSIGGGMTNLLACDEGTSQRIAAFAPVSGAYYTPSKGCNAETLKLICNPGRNKIPLIEFHGGNDTTISYSGGERNGECLPTIPHFVREWAIRDGLGTKNKTTPLAANAVTYSYGSGQDEGLVQHVFESDIGHDWPSTKPNHDNTKPGRHVASFNATPIILDFFSKHRLPA